MRGPKNNGIIGSPDDSWPSAPSYTITLNHCKRSRMDENKPQRPKSTPPLTPVLRKLAWIDADMEKSLSFLVIGSEREAKSSNSHAMKNRIIVI